MSSGKDWFPGTRDDVLALAKRWSEVLSECDDGTTANMVAWGVTVATVQEMEVVRQKCLPYQEWEILGQLTSDKLTAYKGLIEEIGVVMRELHYEFYKPKFLPENLVRLGLPPRKKPGKGGSVADPEDHVEYEISIDPIGRRIIIRFRILGSKRWGKGRYHCVEIRFWVLPLDAPAPVDGEAPGWQSDEDTASPWEIICKGEDAGKRLWVAMRWKNDSTGNKNQKSGKGPWSAIQGVVIP